MARTNSGRRAPSTEIFDKPSWISERSVDESSISTDPMVTVVIAEQFKNTLVNLLVKWHISA